MFPLAGSRSEKNDPGLAEKPLHLFCVEWFPTLLLGFFLRYDFFYADFFFFFFALRELCSFAVGSVPHGQESFLIGWSHPKLHKFGSIFLVFSLPGNFG